VGFRAAAFRESNAAVEIDGLIAVEDTELDGDPTGASVLDCLPKNGCPDAASLEFRQHDEFADVNAIRVVHDRYVTTGSAVTLEDLELPGRPILVEKLVLERLVPTPELAHHDIVVGRVMGVAGKPGIGGQCWSVRQPHGAAHPSK
jgi:hypothetical protein